MTQAVLDQKFLVDPYALWIEGEHIPLHRADIIRLDEASIGAWDRFGLNGCSCEVEGRCDYISLFIFDLKPKSASKTIHHIFDASYIVLKGEGATSLTLSNGETHRLDWRAGHIFTVPANCHYQHTAHTQPTRLLCVNDMRYLMGLYRNEKFIFEHPAAFAERQRKAMMRGLIYDSKTHNTKSPYSPKIGDHVIALDLLTLPARSKLNAHRQMQGMNIVCLEGAGVIISCDEHQKNIHQRTIRSHDLMGLKSMNFHQITNPFDAPLTLACLALGSQHTPIFRSRRFAYGDKNVYASGEAVIAFDAESPALRDLWTHVLSDHA
jgi:hypothetical protein